jgi:hypothetical protein
VSEDTNELQIGLAKLRLRSGDLLIIGLPDSWPVTDVIEFEAGLRAEFSEQLTGVAIMVIPVTSQIFVRHRREPSGTAALRQMPPATKAVN